MKKIIFILFYMVIMNLPIYVFAQIPNQGFFIGGNVVALLMNGEGEMDDEDFSVTDDLFIMEVTETPFEIEATWEYPGWGWGSKLLFGLQPVVGYRISPQFAMSLSYNYYFKKSSDQTDSFTSSIVSPGLQIGTTADMEYSQSAVQILAQYYPVVEGGVFLFLEAGVEFVSMDAEANTEWTITDPGVFTQTDSWKAKGSDNVIGFIIGGGIEVPAISQNISFIATVLYSFTNYDGDDLLEVKKPSVTDPNIPIELGVGGFIGNAGLRMYFSSNQGAESTP